MNRIPDDPTNRRKFFAPMIIALAREIAPSNLEARAPLEEAGFEEIEPAHGMWEKLEPRSDGELYITLRVKDAMLRVLQARPELLPLRPTLQRMYARQLDRLVHAATDDEALQTELKKLCGAALEPALGNWGGRTFPEHLEERLESTIARHIRVSLPEKCSLTDEPQLAGLLLGLSSTLIRRQLRKLVPNDQGSLREKCLGAAENKLLDEFLKWDPERSFRPWARVVAWRAMIDASRQWDPLRKLELSQLEWTAEEPLHTPPRGAAFVLLEALGDALDAMYAARALSGNQLDAWHELVDDYRAPDAEKHESDRKTKQRVREKFEPYLHQSYLTAGCPDVAETMIGIVRRLFRSQTRRRFSDHDLLVLEQARIHLQRQVQEGRNQSPEWTLKLVLAVLNINKTEKL